MAAYELLLSIILIVAVSMSDCVRYDDCIDQLAKLVNQSCADPVLTAQGKPDVISVVAATAGLYSIPVVGHVVDGFMTDLRRLNPRYLPTNLAPQHVMRAIDEFVRSRGLCCCIIIFIQDILLYDGFLDRRPSYEDPSVYVIDQNANASWSETLSSLRDQPCRVVVTHMLPSLSEDFLRLAEEMSLYNKGWVWIIGTLQAQSNFVVSPQGTLIVKLTTDADNRQELRSIGNQLARLQNPSNREAFIKDYHRNFSGQPWKGEGFNVVYADGKPNTQHVFNYRSGGFNVTKRIIWPGEAVNGPIGNNEKLGMLRVVSVPEEPFLIMSNTPIGLMDQCIMSSQCILINSTDRRDILRVEQLIRNGSGDDGGLFTVYCCSGYIVDLLQQMSNDLLIRPMLYMAMDGKFGDLVNKSWNGLVGDVVDKFATIAAAALTVTSRRLQAISFAPPFMPVGIAVLVRRRPAQPYLMAFLRPLDGTMWAAVCCCALVVAVISAVQWWLSPFSEKNSVARRVARRIKSARSSPVSRPALGQNFSSYTLGSALLYCFSLLWSNLIQGKSPQSPAVRIVLNSWAFACIIFLSSYTANLTAHLASQQEVLSISSLSDDKLLSIRVGTTRSGAILESLRPALRAHLDQYSEETDAEGIKKLRTGQLDAWITDTPVAFHAETNDPDCSLHIAVRSTRTYNYALAFAKYSPFEKLLAQLMVDYERNGFFESLFRRWFPGKQCSIDGDSASPIDLDQLGGLTITLGCTMVVLFLVSLPMEYIMYHFLVPRLRQPKKTPWWQRGFLFLFSQRLYRTVNSDRVLPTSHAAMRLWNDLRAAVIRSPPNSRDQNASSTTTVVVSSGNADLSFTPAPKAYSPTERDSAFMY